MRLVRQPPPLGRIPGREERIGIGDDGIDVGQVQSVGVRQGQRIDFATTDHAQLGSGLPGGRGERLVP